VGSGYEDCNLTFCWDCKQAGQVAGRCCPPWEEEHYNQDHIHTQGCDIQPGIVRWTGSRVGRFLDKVVVWVQVWGQVWEQEWEQE